MHIRKILVGAAAAVATVALGGASLAGFVRQGVHGRMAAVAEDGAERGRFEMDWIRTDRSRVIDRVRVECTRLDVTADDSGNRPVYDLWLIDADESVSVDFGDLTLTRRGRGGFRLNTRVDDLPDGVRSVADFSGGTIEVRSGDTAVLRAAIPTFRGPGDEGGAGAVGVRRDRHVLTPPSGSRGRGSVEARFARNVNGTNEQVWVKLGNLQPGGSPYSVVVIDAEDAETELLTLRTRGRFGEGLRMLDTRRGDEIPGGSVADLSGLDVEVRDKDGNVVLTGTFPDVAVATE